ncbi:MAG: hypothetical protein JF616_15000 [Fibrobacteres bacterium]|jgi:hypothetical protein|nr:hypothetical protein [Fibrobacterota bacterium]
MRKRHSLFAAFLLGGLTALAGCGTEPQKGDSLDIESSPLPAPFRVGDTSSFWIVSKTVILANGKTSKTADYSAYRLVSSDTTVVGVFEDKRLVGRKAGTAEVKATDTKSNLVSQTSVNVTVTAP